jgi:rod shape-determining protein MreD
VTEEVSVTRKALAAAVLAAAIFLAVVAQLTVLNRLPLPGGAAPDLVLLLVTAVAVFTGPVTGAVTGFAGGLALDVAPPSIHYAGEYALVFCLAGYAAARVVRAIWDRAGERDTVMVFTVMAVAAAAGEAGKAALGMLLSDPDVTTATASRVLPAAILYDLLLSPLVFWLVARVTGGAALGAAYWNTGAERAPAPEFGRAPALVFRQASLGAAPGLRLAGTGENYRGPSRPRRIPKLRLSGAPGGSSHRTTAASSASALSPLAGGRTPRLNFAGDLPVRAAPRTVRTPGRNWLRTAGARSAARPSARTSPAIKSPNFKQPARPAVKRQARTPGRGWLRSAGSGRLAGGPPRGSNGLPRGFMSHGRTAGSPLAAHPARSADQALAARSAPSGLSALSGPGTPLARRRSPSRGWLRGSGSPGPTFSRQRRSPRSGWLGSASRPRTVIGSRVGARAFRGRRTGRGNWYTASPSGAWLRRGRRPWRKRGYLPGRRPVASGSRAMARAGVVSRTRKPRLFGLLGGNR